MLEMIEKVRLALRLTVSAYDSELQDLISAALLDLGLAGVVIPEEPDALVSRAVVTYCRMHFNPPEGQEFDRLKASYDEQKAQLMTATGYTNWGDET